MGKLFGMEKDSFVYAGGAMVARMGRVCRRFRASQNNSHPPLFCFAHKSERRSFIRLLARIVARSRYYFLFYNG
jgi:hypothetical protein